MHKDARHFGGWEHRDVHNMYGLLQVHGHLLVVRCGVLLLRQLNTFSTKLLLKAISFALTECRDRLCCPGHSLQGLRDTVIDLANDVSFLSRTRARVCMLMIVQEPFGLETTQQPGTTCEQLFQCSFLSALLDCPSLEPTWAASLRTQNRTSSCAGIR